MTGRNRATLLDRLPERVSDPIRRWRRAVLLQLPSQVRLPAVTIDLRGWLPCWVLRLVAALVALGTASLVIRGGFGWTVVSVLALVILVRPASPAAAVLVVVLGFSLLQSPAQVWGVRGPLLLLGSHLCVALGVLLGVTSWSARVQLTVFGRAGLRFGVIQLIAQLTGVLGALLAGRQVSWPWIPLVAALAALLLAYLWLPRLRRPQEDPSPPRTVQPIDAMARRWGDE